MPEEGHLPRVYGEKEVGELLKRATELQEQESVASARVSGLTLEELEEIAGEAGIDPRHLQRAAVELDSRVASGSEWERLAGAPVTLLMESTVRGEVSDEGFERLVEVIQQYASTQGQPSLMGRTLTWRAVTPTNTRTLQILVTSRDGETRIRIEERLHQMAGGLFGGIMGGVGGGVGLGVGLGVGVGALGSALFSVAFPLGVLGLSYLGAKEIFRVVSRSRQKELARLQDGLVRAVAEIAQVPPSPESGARPALPRGPGRP